MFEPQCNQRAFCYQNYNPNEDLRVFKEINYSSKYFSVYLPLDLKFTTKMPKRSRIRNQ